MKKMKSVIGILLILISISSLILWEWKGREVILMEEVLLARNDIQTGDTVRSEMFIKQGVSKDNLLEHAMRPEDLAKLEGKVASQYIAKNSQIIMAYFSNDEFRFKQNESVYVIDPGWIAMRSSALRRGDMVDIYGTNGRGMLGTFRIAFVKDEAEREVRDAGEIVKPNDAAEILDRLDSTSVIDHIEIITTFSEYMALVDCVTGEDGTTPAALIIVQREGDFE